jgi:hypothetical protein
MVFGRVAQYTIVFTAGMASMLAGGSLVHTIFKPNQIIPIMIPVKKEEK